MNTKQNPPLPPNQHFGYLLTAVLALLAAYGFSFNSRSLEYTIALLFTAALALLITLKWPSLLAPFNKAWFSLGQLLGKIVSPIILGLIFFIIITPTAVICRMMGRDELKLKRTAKSSYWIDRASPGSEAKSFKNQF